MDHFIPPPSSSPNAHSLLDSSLFSPLDPSLTSQVLPPSSSASNTSPSNNVTRHSHSGQSNSTAASSSSAAAAAAAAVTGHNTATPVISLFKLKNFLYQPKFKPSFVQSPSEGDKTGDHSLSLHSRSITAPAVFCTFSLPLSLSLCYL